MRLDYTIVFAESWRIGSGEAAGQHLDGQVRKDSHGLPFVPGSTVRGLARQELSWLAEVFGEELCDGSLERRDGTRGTLCGVDRKALCARCALTGSPHSEGRVGWGAARLGLGGVSEQRRGRLAAQAALVPGLLTRAHPRTSLDDRSGRAEDERLFCYEEAIADLEVGGVLEIDPGLPPRYIALLVAALRAMREVGGGRRRGLGACRIRIDRAELDPAFQTWQDAVRSLEAMEEESDRGTTVEEAAARGPVELAAEVPPLARGGARERSADAAVAREARPAVLQITATTVGEVVLGGRPEAGNLIAGLAHIPGSTLRGALAARWRGDRDRQPFHRCFLSGAVRFGFLYPLVDQVTGRPLPLSSHTCKLRPGRQREFGHGVVDLLLNAELERCGQCRARLVPQSPRFVTAGGEHLPQLALSPHNRIEPEREPLPESGSSYEGFPEDSHARPDNDPARETSLFAYEALPEGTQLRGFVRADDAGDLEELLRALGLGSLASLEVAPASLDLRVGRRKGALGHLACQVEVPTGIVSEVGLFADAPMVPRSGAGSVRIDLLTPAILMDRSLRYRTALAPADLGLEGKRFDGAFFRTEVVAGWNSTHRLPKADAVAVVAGSSYLLNGLRDRELETLRRAALQGVGRRRVEGFGAVAVSAVEET